MPKNNALKKACTRYAPGKDGLKERDGFVCPRGSGMKWFPCVAVKVTKDGASVRDTKDVTDKTLSYTKREWKVFVDAVKAGQYDI